MSKFDCKDKCFQTIFPWKN